MNIFVVDEDPFSAATSLCDRHVVKMVLESCQMLSTADQLFRNCPKDQRYKIAYKHHPCVRCLQNSWNYIWLVHHLRGLLNEYTQRFGKIHSCESLYGKYWSEFGENQIDFSRTEFPKCMPEELKEGTTVQAYRRYYSFKQDHLKSFSYKIAEHRPIWLPRKDNGK